MAARATFRRLGPPLKTRFIVNPRSGRAHVALPAIRDFARRHGAEVRPTERPRHASVLAREALDAGCDRIVAVGGDGTMNEIASVLAGTPAVLALVPCGSGDGLGRHLGIHGSPEHALRIFVEGRIRIIDTGLADGHPFFTASGLGFEAEIARRFNALTRRGFARYVSTSARAFRQWEAEEYTIDCGATRTRMKAFTVVVANANQYGNDARIAPRARVDDGILDLCALPPVGWSNAVPLLSHLFRGTIDRARGVHTAAAPSFVIERAAPGPLHTDGELHDAGTRIEFTVRPASLRIMAP